MSRAWLLFLFFAAMLLARLPVMLTHLDAWQSFEVHTGNIAMGILDGLDLKLDRLPAMPHNRGNVPSAFLLAPLYALMGPTAVAMKLLPVLWHAFTVMLLVAVLDRFFNRRTAVACGLLFLFAPPMFIKLSVLGYASHMEATLFMVLPLLPFFAITLEGRADARRYLLFGLACGAAAFFHLQALLFCLVLMALLLIQRPRETLQRGALWATLGMAVTGAPAFLFSGGNVAYVEAAIFRDRPPGSALDTNHLDKLAAFVQGGGVETLEFGEAGATLGTILGSLYALLLGAACMLAVVDDWPRLTAPFRSVFAFRSAELSPATAFVVHPTAVMALFFISSMQLNLGNLGSGYENRRLLPALFSLLLLAAIGLGRKSGRRLAMLWLLCAVGAAGLVATARPNPAAAIPQRGEAYEWFGVHLQHHADGDPVRMVDTITRIDRGDWRFATMRYHVLYPDLSLQGDDVLTREREARSAAGRPYDLFRATSLGWAYGFRGDPAPPPELIAELARLPPAHRAAVLHGIGLGMRRMRPNAQPKAYQRSLQKLRRYLASFRRGDRAVVAEGFGFARGFVLMPYIPALLRPLQDFADFEPEVRDGLMRGFGWGYRQRWIEPPDQIPTSLGVLEVVTGPGRDALLDGLLAGTLPPEAAALTAIDLR